MSFMADRGLPPRWGGHLSVQWRPPFLLSDSPGQIFQDGGVAVPRGPLVPWLLCFAFPQLLVAQSRIAWFWSSSLGDRGQPAKGAHRLHPQLRTGVWVPRNRAEAGFRSQATGCHHGGRKDRDRQSGYSLCHMTKETFTSRSEFRAAFHSLWTAFSLLRLLVHGI